MRRLLQHYSHLVGASPPPVHIAEPAPRRNKPARLPPPSPTETAEPVAIINPYAVHPHDAEARAGFALELAIARGEIDLAPVADPIEVEPVETIDADAEPIEAEVDPIEAADAEPIQAAPALQASIGRILSRR
jgi:hypothetical protein